jgi:uncharacterized protein (DUF2141 family)
MISRWLAAPVAGLLLTSGANAGSAAQTGSIHVTVTDLRSTKGEVHACLAPTRDSFPDCEKGAVRTLTLPASQPLEFTFSTVPNGRYAIALMHDENANGKIDKALLIPREGFGFSRDAPLRMGPPSFKDAAFDVDGKGINQSIRMRYII